MAWYWYYGVLFCVAFAAAVVATPWAIALAHAVGAVDAPDGFRKHHGRITPRMGGVAVVVGVAVALLVYRLTGVGPAAVPGTAGVDLPYDHPFALAALALILAVGVQDDRRGLPAMFKLLCQAGAASLLYAAGFRIDNVFCFGVTLELGVWGFPVTLFWFLGCMNVWNLIDGMDGLASGAGAIVCGALAVAAALMGHEEVALAACALAGALAGFLVFNFHPAKVFLGDTGSLFIGTVLGMLAVRGSLKGGVTVAILVPLLAMGLPIFDTLLAIGRRWIRHLPWSAPDHGHLHHRLIAFGLNPRQAALLLYSFTLVLGAAAVASVTLQSDALAALFAVLVVAAFSTVFVARTEERRSLWDDLRRRVGHRRREKKVARVVWEAIQRLPHAPAFGRLDEILETLALGLRCAGLTARYSRDGHRVWSFDCRECHAETMADAPATVALRLDVPGWPGERLQLELVQPAGGDTPLAVAGPSLERLADRLLERARFLTADLADVDPAEAAGEAFPAAMAATA